MNYITGNYSVNLEVFHGPLDLLLYLIKKDEINIYDIPIARVTEQYMRYLEMMKSLNLDLAGEYILVAATLIRIKARMLLPRVEGEGDEPDPREELVAALLEYRRYKEAGEILREKRTLEERVFAPPPIGDHGAEKERVVLSDSTTLFDLLTAFREVLERVEQEKMFEVNAEEFTIEERVEKIMEVLAKKEWATFQELFEDIPRKTVAILTFLAILELVRLKRVTVRQSMPFSELRVYQGDQFKNPQPAIEFIRHFYMV
jgi:segregation and condensation protein A